MAFFEVRPFEVGKTYGMTTAPVTGDPSLAYEGLEVYVEDKDPTQPLRRSTRIRKLRVVRNACVSGSGGTTTGLLLPKRLVRFHAPANGTASFYGQRVDGYSIFGVGATSDTDGSTLVSEKSYPVDEYVVSTGVAINDLFYVVVEGPAACLMPMVGGGDISVGNPLTSATAVTTGATTAGRVQQYDFNRSTTALGAELIQILGRAMTATTSNQTTGAVSILVDIAPVCR